MKRMYPLAPDKWETCVWNPEVVLGGSEAQYWVCDATIEYPVETCFNGRKLTVKDKNNVAFYCHKWAHGHEDPDSDDDDIVPLAQAKKRKRAAGTKRKNKKD